MWPVAILLIAVTLFYWISFCITAIAWLKALAHLCFGNFIRAALWFNVGTAMVLWWTNKWESWDAFWPGASHLHAWGRSGHSRDII